MPPLPGAAPVHPIEQRNQGGDPACVGIEQRTHRSAPARPDRQAHLQAQERDRGAQLRRRQTTARTPLCQDARTKQSAAAMPARRHRSEHQEDRSATQSNKARYPTSPPPSAARRLYRTTPPIPETKSNSSHRRLNCPTKNKTPPKMMGFVSSLGRPEGLPSFQSMPDELLGSGLF